MADLPLTIKNYLSYTHFQEHRGKFINKMLIALFMVQVPTGRGIPDDVLETLANCGPTSAAAYLNKSCMEVIERSYAWQEKGWISIKPMLELLGEFGEPHKSIRTTGEPQLPSEAFGEFPSGLAFIQFTGSGGKYSGWKAWAQAYSHTHWVAYDCGLVYDFNIRHKDGTPGDWIPEKDWVRDIVPILIPRNGTGHYVRNILIPKI